MSGVRCQWSVVFVWSGFTGSKFTLLNFANETQFNGANRSGRGGLPLNPLPRERLLYLFLVHVFVNAMTYEKLVSGVRCREWKSL